MTAPLFSEANPRQPRYRTPAKVDAVGDCPVCGGRDIPIVNRKLAPHGQFVRRGTEEVESDIPCEGGGGPKDHDGATHPTRRTGRRL